MGVGLLAAALAWAVPPAQAPPSPARPNIVLVLFDDLGYGDPGSYNPASKIPTPHIDRLAAEGMRFTDAHAPASVCTPTRYALLTGRYAWRSSLKRGVLDGYSPALLEPGRLTLPRLLQHAGYVTAGVGKWHLGLGAAGRTDYAEALAPGPLAAGFDEYFGIPASLDMPPYLFFENDRATAQPTAHVEGPVPCCVGPFWRSGPVAPGFRHVDVLPALADRAAAFIDSRARTPERPFFLYVPLPSPHTPWLPTDAFKGRSGAGEYGDFTVQSDAVLGRLLDALDRHGLADSTLVIAASDNGAYWRPEEVDRFGHRANGPWRGMKADVWEAGHRIPLLVRWPGRVAARSVSDAVVTLADLMATTAAITGQTLPDAAAEDSLDLLPILRGQAPGPAASVPRIHHSSQGLFAIRDGPWKLVAGLGSGGFTEPRTLEPRAGEPAGQLYHLGDDPGETRNLYAERPEVVSRLASRLKQAQDAGRTRP